jgi:hypothetical protein
MNAVYTRYTMHYNSNKKVDVNENTTSEKTVKILSNSKTMKHSMK